MIAPKKTARHIVAIIAMISAIYAIFLQITRYLEKRNEVHSITLARTSCLGNCPTYSLRIDSKGDVTFIGKADVSRLGIQRGTIAKAAFTELNQGLLDFDFVNIDFPTLPIANDPALVRDKIFKVCPTYFTDHPMMSIEVSTMAGSKKIEYYFGCRGLDIYLEFVELGKKIDQLADSDKWIYPRSSE